MGIVMAAGSALNGPGKYVGSGALGCGLACAPESVTDEASEAADDGRSEPPGDCGPRLSFGKTEDPRRDGEGERRLMAE